MTQDETAAWMGYEGPDAVARMNSWLDSKNLEKVDADAN